jgi:choline dehydrogenase-like flavoprotein
MLANLAEPDRVHPKLRAPALRHVMQGEHFGVYGRLGEPLVDGRGSYANGGMANVWGGQLLRYTQADLDEAGGWPISAEALSGYYDDLEAHIGISGVNDDMCGFLGGVHTALLPPVPVVPAAERLLKRYTNGKRGNNSEAFKLGRPRLAVLTRSYRGFAAYNFGETEFFSLQGDGLYTPRRTLSELLRAAQVRYLQGRKLLRFREASEYVEVEFEHCASGECETLRTRHLLLACGAIQSARLVMLNRGGRERALPFIDHPPTLLPVFFPALFGCALPKSSFPIQLIGSLARGGSRSMVSFYYPGGLLRSDLLVDMRLPLDAALRILGIIVGGMLVAQIWETSQPQPGNRLRLEADDSVRIDYPESKPYSQLSEFLAVLRRLGGLSLPGLASMPLPSRGFHHAACLPMRRDPGSFETHSDGRLWDSRRVRVIDGSVLPSLPAKNHSLTLMANSARIADEAKSCGY